jgi:hypothetical protein
VQAPGLDPFPSNHVADPPVVRGNGCFAAKESLARKTLKRVLVNPEALRLLWRRHQEGEDYSKQLGSAIAIEFIARRCRRERFESIGKPYICRRVVKCWYLDSAMP